MVSLVDPAELAKPLAEQHWTTVVEHSDQVRVNGAGVTSTHLVVSVRKDTIERVQVLPLAGLGTPEQGAPVEPAFEEELYTAGVAGSDYEAPVIRMGYTSYFTPSRVYDFVLPTAEQPAGELLLRKESPVLGGYSAADYVATREWAVAADGTRIPLSVLRHASVQQDSTAAGLVYGYGSYEMSMDPGFGIPRLSLLDRGIVFVIAHIRGGGELGRHWYDDRQEAAEEEHLHGLHRGHRLAGRIRLGGPGPDRGHGRLGRRPADGRRRQPGAGEVRGDRGRRPVRGRPDHHPGSGAAALRAGVGGMGQPDHRPATCTST